jgi:branched-chain amino acid transport system substrate-binding protein
MFRNRFSYIGILFICVLLVALTACGDTQPAGSTSGDGESPSLAQGVTDTEILVGHLGPQTGATAEYDKVRQGIQAYFDVVNENGGVFGRKLTLIAHDDRYQPSETVKGAKRLVEEEKVFAILYPIGTANVNAMKPYLEEKGIPVVGLGTGTNMFVEPPIRNFFGYQFNYMIESRIYVDYAINQLGAKRITLVFQNDDFGKQGLEGAKKAVAEYPGVEVAAEIPFLATDQDFSSQAQ